MATDKFVCKGVLSDCCFVILKSVQWLVGTTLTTNDSNNYTYSKTIAKEQNKKIIQFKLFSLNYSIRIAQCNYTEDSQNYKKHNLSPILF